MKVQSGEVRLQDLPRHQHIGARQGGGEPFQANFGVVYQIKKLRVLTESQAERVYAELKGNFDSERLQDGNVILVIDDISKEVRKYLINMKVQSISKNEVLETGGGF